MTYASRPSDTYGLCCKVMATYMMNTAVNVSGVATFDVVPLHDRYLSCRYGMCVYVCVCTCVCMCVCVCVRVSVCMCM